MRHLPTIILLFSMLTGCLQGTSGQQGNLNFYDQTKTPDFWNTDRQLDAPVATGANLQIMVKHTSDLTVVQTIDSVDFNPAICQKLSTANGIVKLKAKQEGITNMTVNADDLTDNITLQVKTPTTQQIEPRPWQNLYIKPDMFSNGLAVLPGGKIWLFGWQMDEKNNHLTGYGASKWTMDNDVFQSKPVQDSDYLELTAIKNGKSSLHYGKAKYDLWSENEDAAKTMSFYDALGEIPGNNFNIKYGSPTVIYIALYDNDGRLLVGELSTMPQFTSSDNSIIKTSAPTQKDLDNKDPKISWNPSHFVLIQCQVGTGTTDVTVTWSKFTGKFTVNCIEN